MAGEDEDKEQKTEDPTQHRLDEAEKKGQIPVSRELNHFFAFIALAMMISAIFPGIAKDTSADIAHFITDPHDYVISENLFRDLLKECAIILGKALMMPIMLVIFLVVGVSVWQGKMIVAVDRIAPKWDKVSPIKGFSKLFSAKTIVEFFKSLIKILVVGAVGYYCIASDLDKMELYPTYPPVQLLEIVKNMAIKAMIGICAVMFLVAVLDFAYQRYDFMKSLRMTKQEIKDEHKQQEGDPHIKGKLRALRMEKSRKRMMANVPKSDVIITNPTHFAVALSYDSDSMQAPKLLAKGTDKVAFKIRELAKEHDIPIVENPPLARALHASVELDQEIPYEHYKAVAEVIGYVYRIKGKKKKK